MRTCRLSGLVAVLLLPAMTVVAAEPTKEEAIKKDRKQVEGVWKIVAIVSNGDTVDELQARKFTIVNEPFGNWRLLSEDKEMSRGTSEFDPTQEPKTVDFIVTEGAGEGNQHSGIYELGENTRQLCFAEPGKERPREFSSLPGSGHVLIRLERVKPE